MWDWKEIAMSSRPKAREKNVKDEEKDLENDEAMEIDKELLSAPIKAVKVRKKYSKIGLFSVDI